MAEILSFESAEEINFIPRVEPIFKKRTREEEEEAEEGGVGNNASTTVVPDPSLAGMRGREEEGVSDEIVTNLHMCYLACSDSEANSRRCAQSTSSSLLKGQGDSPLLSSFALLDKAMHLFSDRFSALLQFQAYATPSSMKDRLQDSTTEAFFANLKKMSPESVGYNQQAKPAVGSLITALMYLLEATDDANVPKSRECEKRRVFSSFLVKAFGFENDSIGCTAQQSAAAVVALPVVLLLPRLAHWLAFALDAGALWVMSKKMKEQLHKRNKQIGSSIEEAQHEDHETAEGGNAGEPVLSVVAAFLASPASAFTGTQVPICLQVQRIELFAYLLRLEEEEKREKDNNNASVSHQQQPRRSRYLSLQLRLLARVSSILLGASGHAHHAHNARRNIAAWKQLARMLRCLSPPLSSSTADAAADSSSSSSSSSASSFIRYLEYNLLHAFTRRDRGIAATCNLYRRRLEDSLVSFNGLTVEALRARMMAEAEERSSDKAPPEAADDGNWVRAAHQQDGNTTAAEACSGGEGGGGAPSSSSIVSHYASSSAESMQMLAHHQQGYHDMARRMSTAAPTADEMREAWGLIADALLGGVSLSASSEAVIEDASIRPFITLVAMFWLRPPCVGAA